MRKSAFVDPTRELTALHQTPKLDFGVGKEWKGRWKGGKG